MKLQANNKNTVTVTRTTSTRANDIVDEKLFEFVHDEKLAPNLTALYSVDNATKNQENMWQFVNGDLNRVHVRAQFAHNLYDMRLAVLHAATIVSLVRIAKATYAKLHNGATLDDKSALAAARARESIAYQNIIKRAISAHLFDTEAYARVALAYANGEIAAPPFAKTIKAQLPPVTTRGVSTVTYARPTKRAPIPFEIPADVLDTMLSDAIAMQ